MTCLTTTESDIQFGSFDDKASMPAFQPLKKPQRQLSGGTAPNVQALLNSPSRTEQSQERRRRAMRRMSNERFQPNLSTCDNSPCAMPIRTFAKEEVGEKLKPQRMMIPTLEAKQTDNHHHRLEPDSENDNILHVPRNIIPHSESSQSLSSLISAITLDHGIDISKFATTSKKLTERKSLEVRRSSNPPSMPMRH